MSKTVDERVVSMQFDNKNFEKNVATSMSTLEKLKQKLSFKGATKGLESIDSAVKKVNMSNLAKSVDTVSVRFSALQVAGTTALVNLTNSAVNSAKRMLNAFSFEPIISGFREYETQLNAVQTILANTQHEGTTLDQVNAALDELNTYADKTIYNFTEMTRNIGTFTAAGVSLDKSVDAIKGIANLAAVSGSTSQQASTAMYQLSQALAAGRVSLMDWNSVVNAGMGGKVFQDALKRTATQMGKNVDALIQKYGSFRESLTQGGWLTTEVLTETLKQFAGAYTEADLIQQGYSKSQAAEIVKMAQTAEDAATKVKTFTQLIDTTKEALGSGWAQTWEIVFGDFEEAKELWTSISDVVTGFITNMSDARNNLLEGALNSNFDKMQKKLEEAGISSDKLEASLSKILKGKGYDVDALTEKYGSLANAIKKGAAPAELLTKALEELKGMIVDLSGVKAGLKLSDDLTKVNTDVSKVQEVLRNLGYDVGKFGKNLDGVDGKFGEVTESAVRAFQEMEGLKVTGIVDQETLDALDRAQRGTNSLWKEIITLSKSVDQMGGRELLIDAFANALQPIGVILKAIGEAWSDAFPANPEGLYNAIKAFHSFTENLVIGDETAKNITRTLKGVFAVLDLITMVIGGGFTLAFKVVAKVVETLWQVLGFGTANILEITAAVGDAVVAFRDWVEEHNLLFKAIEVAVPAIIDFVKWIAELASTLYKMSGANKIVDGIVDVFKEMGEYISNIDFAELGQNIIDGLANGLSGGAQAAWDAIVEVATGIKDKFCSLLGIHSPSTVFEGYGKNIIEGLVNGITGAVSWVLDAISSVVGTITGFDYSIIGDKFSDVFSPVIDFFKSVFSKIASIVSSGWDGVVKVLSSIKMEHILAGIGLAGFIFLAKMLMNVVGIFSKVGDGLDNIMDKFGDVLGSTSKLLNAKAGELRTQSLLNVAKSILIIVAALTVLTLLDQDKLSSAVATLIIVMGGLLLVTKLASKIGDAKGIAKLGATMLLLSVAMIAMSGAAKILGGMSTDEFIKGLTGIGAIIIALSGILAAYGTLVKGKSANNIGKLGSMMLKLSISLLLMVAVIKLISGLSVGELIKGGAAITAFVGIMYLLAKVSNVAGKNISKLGSTMLKLSVSLILMVAVIKLISGLSVGELIKGGVAITAFVGIMYLLAKVSNVGNKNISRFSSAMIKMSVAMGLMAIVVRLISGLSVGEMLKGGAAITAFVGIIALLAKVSKSIEKDIPRFAGTLLTMSIAIGILAAVAIALSLVSIEGLLKGVTAVSVLGLVMAAMIAATKGAVDCRKNLLMMSLAIGIMAAAVAALSFIDTTKLAAATASMGILMGMFAIMTKASSAAKGSVAQITMMIAVIGALSTVVYFLSKIDAASAIPNVLALSTLMVAMSSSLALIGTVGKTSGKASARALISIGTMTAVAYALTGVVAILSTINADSALPNVIALSTLLVSMSAACAVASIAGKAGIAGLVGIGLVLVFIAGITALLTAMGAIFTPEMETALDNGIRILTKIGFGLGEAIGSVISGFGVGLTSGLGEIGTNLSNFMTNLQPFLNGAKKIDPNLADGVQSLALAILTLTGANILDKLTSWFMGDNSFAEFGDQLVEFGTALVRFSSTVAGKIDEKAVTAAANAGKVMTAMASDVPNSGGVLGWIMGENDLDDFGDKLVSFGESIVEFSSTVAGKIDEKAVTAAANAGKVMTSMASEIPNDGGVLGWIVGNNSIDDFGDKLVSFGDSIVSFSSTVAGNVDENAVTAAANAGKVMASMASEIPNDGGLLGWIVGNNSIDDFGDKLVSFGDAIVDFSGTVDGNINETAVTAAANAGSLMATLAEKLPNSGGVLGFFTGNNDIDDFGEKLEGFGKAMVKFSESVEGVSSANVTRVANAASALVELCNDTKDIDTSGVSNFATAATTLSGVKFSSFDDDIDVDSMFSYARVAERLATAVKTMTGIDSSGANSFKEAINSLAGTNVSGFVSAFSSVSLQDMSTVGFDIIGQLAKGMSNNSSAVTTSATTIIDNAIKAINGKKSAFINSANSIMTSFANAIRSKSSTVASSFNTAMLTCLISISVYSISFYNAGANLARGFANGISANSYLAAAKASAMASAAAEAARRALDEHSPSKVMYKIGDYAGQGFVNALSSYRSISGNAGSAMADSAISGLRDTLSNLGSVIDSDIDINPTIRPVLDMSSVRAGIGVINGLSGLSPSMSLLADVRSINSSVNARRQNGANDDVVSELKRLRTGIKEMPRNSYNVNGITYDDGSAVGNAIGALVRAVRIEGRV